MDNKTIESTISETVSNTNNANEAADLLIRALTAINTLRRLIRETLTLQKDAD